LEKLETYCIKYHRLCRAPCCAARLAARRAARQLAALHLTAAPPRTSPRPMLHSRRPRATNTLQQLVRCCLLTALLATASSARGSRGVAAATAQSQQQQQQQQQQPPPPAAVQRQPAPAPAPQGAPNVLFIAIDDMRPSIGAMGAPVLTPAMDKLASESLMFDRAFANFPW
jgi:hypothetical protein